MDERSYGGTAPETTVEEEQAICKNGDKWCDDSYLCYDCEAEKRKRIEEQREKIDRRHLEYLREIENPKMILAPPQGAISDAILKEMGIYACKGYRTGERCYSTTHRCEHGSILWLNYEKSWSGKDGQCESCRKKDTYKWSKGCGIRGCNSCGI